MPLRTKREHRNSYPWLSNEVKALISKCEYLFCVFKKSKSIKAHLENKKARNKVNTMVRMLKREY